MEIMTSATFLTLLPASSLLLFVLYRYLIYPTLLSPLCKIPNAHWTSSISPFWILMVRFQRRENRVLLAAHRRLGPVIRVGPNELSINDVEDVRTVYQGGFEKPEWYSVFDNYGVPCMFSTGPSREHALRKRMISNVYSKSYIQSSPAARSQGRRIIFSRLLPILESSMEARQQPHGIDVHSLFLAATMDFISAYVFGIRRSTDFLGRDRAYREHWLSLYAARAGYPFFSQELPGLTRLLSALGVRLYPRWVDEANRELGEWNRRLCTATLASGAARDGPSQKKEKVGEEEDDDDGGDDPVVVRALLSGLDREKEANGDRSILYPTALRRHDLSVASELFDHVLAGQETAGITLTYLVWRLSGDLRLQRDLHRELMTLEPNMKVKERKEEAVGDGAGDGDGKTAAGEGRMPNPKALDALALLHAVLTETLRLHAAIPGPQPRRTPDHPPCRIGAYTVPGGVRVAAAAHTLHRHEGVFPRPEEWDHTRWLGGDEEARKARSRQFWAFGSGGRMCIGSNFAVHEIKLIVAAIYSNYTTHIVDAAGMEQGDGYTVGPRSGRLYIRFEPVP